MAIRVAETRMTFTDDGLTDVWIHVNESGTIEVLLGDDKTVDLQEARKLAELISHAANHVEKRSAEAI